MTVIVLTLWNELEHPSNPIAAIVQSLTFKTCIKTRPVYKQGYQTLQIFFENFKHISDFFENFFIKIVHTIVLTLHFQPIRSYLIKYDKM